MKKKFFFCILKITEERSRIRSWIRIYQSEVRICESGSAPKFHGSPHCLEGSTSIQSARQASYRHISTVQLCFTMSSPQCMMAVDSTVASHAVTYEHNHQSINVSIQVSVFNVKIVCFISLHFLHGLAGYRYLVPCCFIFCITAILQEKSHGCSRMLKLTTF